MPKVRLTFKVVIQFGVTFRAAMDGFAPNSQDSASEGDQDRTCDGTLMILLMAGLLSCVFVFLKSPPEWTVTVSGGLQ